MKRTLSLLLLACFLAMPALAQKQKKKTPASKTKTANTISLEQYKALVNAVGSISSGHLYFSYWALNTLADNAAKNMYDAGGAKTLVSTYYNLIQKAMLSLIDVRNTSTNTTDRAFLTSMLYAYNDLDSSAKCLFHYYDSKDSGQLVKFHQIHKQAWGKISDLLGLAPKNTPAKEMKKEPAAGEKK